MEIEKSGHTNEGLRSNILKAALKTFIVPAYVAKYQVIAVRTLWSYERLKGEEGIWKKKRELQELLYRKLHNVNKHLVMITMVRR